MGCAEGRSPGACPEPIEACPEFIEGGRESEGVPQIQFLPSYCPGRGQGEWPTAFFSALPERSA